MAAATLKSIAVWIERQVEGPAPCQGLVLQVLQRLVQESNPDMARPSWQGPSMLKDNPWLDSVLPTRHSMFDTDISG